MKLKVCGEFLIEVAVLDMEGKTLSETAEALGCDINTVRKARRHELYTSIFMEAIKIRMAARLSSIGRAA